MATLVLTIAAYAVTAGSGPFAAFVAVTAASFVGQVIDKHLFAPKTQNVVVPPPGIPKIQTSSYGRAIPYIYGEGRLAGNVLAMGNFRQTPTGSGGNVSSYEVLGDAAVAICAVSRFVGGWGQLASIKQIRFDSKLVYDVATGEKTDFGAFTLYNGSESQAVNSGIEGFTDIGTGNVPAFRGLAYVYLTDIQFHKYGNRLPNIDFVVVSDIP